MSDESGKPETVNADAREPNRPKVLRDTDDEARRLARTLVRGARLGAIAVIDPATGYPFASRVLIGTDVDGVPVTLVSALSTHTSGLDSDPRASLLVGEPGKGDPLAHPRVTVRCEAVRVGRDTAEHARIRRRFVARHPKAELYVDFGDFAFFRLVPQGASLNGGFGKAYVLDADDLMIRSPAVAALTELEESAIAHMNEDHAEAASAYARHFGGMKDGNWRICGIDASGLDLSSGDRLLRIEFDSALSDAGELRKVLADMMSQTR